MKIVLTGSLGHIGKPLATILAKANHDLSIITSSEANIAAIESLGAKALVGSIEDVNFLTESFRGADLIYGMVPPNYAVPDIVSYYRDIALNYAEAIKQSGVKRAIYLSSFGADLDKNTGPILGSHYGEAILDAIPGISLTIMRPGYFFYNFESYIPMIRHTGAISLNYGGDYKLPLVAPADIATAIAEEMEAAPVHRKIRYVASEELSTNEVVKILGDAIGLPDLQWKFITDQQRKSDLVANGVPEKMAGYLTDMGATLHSGLLAKEYFLNRPAVFGKTKFADYVSEFVAKYQAYT